MKNTPRDYADKISLREQLRYMTKRIISISGEESDIADLKYLQSCFQTCSFRELEVPVKLKLKDMQKKYNLRVFKSLEIEKDQPTLKEEFGRTSENPEYVVIRNNRTKVEGEIGEYYRDISRTYSRHRYEFPTPYSYHNSKDELVSMSDNAIKELQRRAGKTGL